MSGRHCFLSPLAELTSLPLYIDISTVYVDGLGGLSDVLSHLRAHPGAFLVGNIDKLPSIEEEEILIGAHPLLRRVTFPARRKISNNLEKGPLSSLSVLLVAGGGVRRVGSAPFWREEGPRKVIA